MPLHNKRKYAKFDLKNTNQGALLSKVGSLVCCRVKKRRERCHLNDCNLFC